MIVTKMESIQFTVLFNATKILWVSLVTFQSINNHQKSFCLVTNSRLNIIIPDCILNNTSFDFFLLLNRKLESAQSTLLTKTAGNVEKGTGLLNCFVIQETPIIMIIIGSEDAQKCPAYPNTTVLWDRLEGSGYLKRLAISQARAITTRQN